MTRNIVYLNRDNKISIKLIDSSVPIVDYSGITRIVIDIGTHIIDSDINAGIIDWSSNTDISIDIGNAGIPANAYTARVITYDINNLKGIVWSDDLIILVKE